jgi:hypothetical protein
MWGGVTSGSLMVEQGPSTHIEEPKLHLIHLSTAKKRPKGGGNEVFFAKGNQKRVYGGKEIKLVENKITINV